ncbi:hypothetical protein ACLIN3_27480 (plasmid) [Pseudomonas orientalis]|uniref:hypothetical protein n=1 Tax=Pseudomonas orientalis TaxID=76758 RepID=UPI0039856F95
MASDLIQSPVSGELVTADEFVNAVQAEIERINNDPNSTIADFDRLADALKRFAEKPAPSIVRT